MLKITKDVFRKVLSTGIVEVGSKEGLSTSPTFYSALKKGNNFFINCDNRFLFYLYIENRKIEFTFGTFCC